MKVRKDSVVETQVVSGTLTVTQGTATSLKAQAEVYQGGSAVAAGNPLQVSLANTSANSTAVKVDGSAVTQPVADGGGSLTIDAPVGTPAFVRLSDGSSAISTLPVSLASVPSHAVTNAGTFPVQDSQVVADNAGFTDGTTKVFLNGYIYDEVAGTALTENDAAAARINVNRAQVGIIEDGSTRGRYATVTASNALKVDGSAVAQPVTDNAASLSVDWNGTQPVTGSGNSTGALRVELPTNGTGTLATVSTVTTVSTLSNTTQLTPGTAAANLGKAEDAAAASGDTGVLSLAVRRDSPSTDVSAAGDYASMQVNRDGALWIAGAAAPTGGWSVATGSIAATKTDIGTANTPGVVAGWYFYNPNTSVAYVQFFNTQASGVTLGTTAPVYSLGIPASGGANIPAGIGGISHSTAICIAVTTTRAGSTGPSSTVDYNIWYKQ